MPNVAKMSVTLTPEMATLIARAVETGEYATTSEVIREALREWNSRRNLLQQEREQIQKLWAEGVASGPGQFKDIEAIKAEARRRVVEETPVNGN
jgi:antitoxin ParD1/3/4